MKTKNMKTPHLRQSISPECFRGFLLIALVCFGLALARNAFGVSPAPDGGYGGQNTAEGTDALFSLTSGVWNVAVGFQALHSDTTGNQNTATGYRALFSNISGNKSTAYGSQALYNNTTGNDNVAAGFSTLFSNVSGNRNTGVGYRTLTFNDANDNTAIGWNGLYNNRTGVQNTAIGSGALLHGNSFSDNTAVGFQALNNNAGNENTGVGSHALFNNTSSEFNVAVGDSALVSFNGTTATDGANTALGSLALNAETSGQENVAVGRRDLEFLLTGSNNTAVGWRAGDNYTGGESGNICIGSFVTGVTGESNKTRIGNITATAFTTGGFFLYEVNGAIGIFSSSRKFKDDIKPIDKASETIYSLNPVTFRAKPEADPSRPRGFGLIAEEVEQVNPDLVSHGEKDILTVRYESINAMLLNEFLKEHKKVQELEATVAQQHKGMEVLAAQLKEQASQIQKVSARLEVSKPAPRTAVNN
jgi:trimeric autotransporter adhesin